jgi:hypothetical protein
MLDKGYDSEEIHQLIRDDLNSYSLIPIRTRKHTRFSGFYRRDLTFIRSASLSSKKLGRNGFLGLQKKVRGTLKARKYSGQIKELKIKLILYIISKIIHAILICISSVDLP